MSSSLADTLAHSPLHSVYTVKCLSMSSSFPLHSPTHHCSVYTVKRPISSLFAATPDHASLVEHWSVRLCLRSSPLPLIYLLLHSGCPRSLLLVACRCSALYFATRFSVSRRFGTVILRDLFSLNTTVQLSALQ